MQMTPVGQKGKINTLDRTGENIDGQCFYAIIFNYR